MSAPQNNAQPVAHVGRQPSRAGGRWLRCLATTALAGAWILAGSAPAHAATSVTQHEDGLVTIWAGEGEENHLIIQASRVEGVGLVLVISDQGDSLAPSSGCEYLTTTVVTCTIRDNAEVRQIQVQSGDMNDTVELTGAVENAIVYGGPGDDTLIGSSQTDLMAGGLGDDVLDGGDGDDQLVGAEGNDTLIGGAGGDYVAGDEGDDIISTVDEVPHNDVAKGGTGNDECSIDVGDTRSGCETLNEQ
jgi:Ca2+-binding RTX toxin-like protein